MIRKLVDWFLCRFHIKIRSDKPAMESLVDLIGIVVACMVVTQVMKYMCAGVKLPWYLWLWYKTKYYVRYARAVVVGY